MRTTIVIDDDLLDAARQYMGFSEKTALVRGAQGLDRAGEWEASGSAEGHDAGVHEHRPTPNGRSLILADT